MEQIAYFLFVIDVSGSMYGQKIASVNASLTECLAELRQIDSEGICTIRVGVVSFSDRMAFHKLNAGLENVDAPHLEVTPRSDGFYPVTSFACLYRGLREIFEKRRVDDGRMGENTFIILFSDAKPVDEREYEEAYEEARQCEPYRNAGKFAAYVEDGSDKYNRNTVRFVDYRAERIVRAADMPGELGRLRMTFFAELANRDRSRVYDRIFG